MMCWRVTPRTARSGRLRTSSSRKAGRLSPRPLLARAATRGPRPRTVPALLAWKYASGRDLGHPAADQKRRTLSRSRVQSCRRPRHSSLGPGSPPPDYGRRRSLPQPFSQLWAASTVKWLIIETHVRGSFCTRARSDTSFCRSGHGGALAPTFSEFAARWAVSAACRSRAEPLLQRLDLGLGAFGV